MIGTFERSSVLSAPAGEVWARVSTTEGINYELRPFLRMTFPPGVARLDPEAVHIGERICRSWVLLFGVLPVDYDDLTLMSIDPPHGFHERSRTLTQRTWEHRRTIEPLGDQTCRLTDQVTFEPRLKLPPQPSSSLFQLAFSWRHVRLRRAFGTPAAPQ